MAKSKKINSKQRCSEDYFKQYNQQWCDLLYSLCLIVNKNDPERKIRKGFLKILQSENLLKEVSSDKKIIELCQWLNEGKNYKPAPKVKRDRGRPEKPFEQKIKDENRDFLIYLTIDGVLAAQRKSHFTIEEIESDLIDYLGQILKIFKKNNISFKPDQRKIKYSTLLIYLKKKAKNQKITKSDVVWTIASWFFEKMEEDRSVRNRISLIKQRVNHPLYGLAKNLDFTFS